MKFGWSMLLCKMLFCVTFLECAHWRKMPFSPGAIDMSCEIKINRYKVVKSKSTLAWARNKVYLKKNCRETKKKKLKNNFARQHGFSLKTSHLFIFYFHHNNVKPASPKPLPVRKIFFLIIFFFCWWQLFLNTLYFE